MKKLISKFFVLLICLFSLVIPSGERVSGYTVENYRNYVYYLGLNSNGETLLAVSQKYYTGTGVGNTGKDSGPLLEKSGEKTYFDLTPRKVKSGKEYQYYGVCEKLTGACNHDGNIVSLYMDAIGNISLDIATGVEFKSLRIYYIMANRVGKEHLFCDSSSICDAAKTVTGSGSSWKKTNKYDQNLIINGSMINSNFEVTVGETSNIYSGYNLFNNLHSQYLSLSDSSGLYVTMDLEVEYNNVTYKINDLSKASFDTVGNRSNSAVLSTSRTSDVSQSAALIRNARNIDIHTNSTFIQINEFFQTTLRPILLVAIGILFVTVGTMTGIKIIKSSDEPEVRSDAIKKFIGLFIGAFAIAMILLFYEDIIDVISGFL